MMELTNLKKVILYKINKGCIISRNGGTFMIKYIHKKTKLYNNTYFRFVNYTWGIIVFR